MDLKRRLLLASGALALLRTARAHHGWSSFDQSRPIYIEGAAREVRWRNPHVELVLELPPTLALPPDLRQRPLPAQSANVDGTTLLANAKLPSRKDKRWTVELAPLTRMQAWNVPRIERDTSVGVLGFTFAEEKGDPVLRAEYLFLDGKTYGLRSSPA
ncbi:DUF6152 family protein [Azohydromonas caseinilytica]|uniref:Uncharacterized protein n=1 Tax=Azohydromonas caseinilytica TaxID=2728836 RepID=A0A848FCK8_9BURK|nr:DUF6152 family protein [Azohydromonas caseinilytica]NML15691.1 hypothetical protein [Azohydromonas caseinilytica]